MGMEVKGRGKGKKRKKSGRGERGRKGGGGCLMAFGGMDALERLLVPAHQ